MSNNNHLNHSTWDCKYHVVFTPKYRKKSILGLIRQDLGDVFHRLSRQKECIIEDGHLLLDHVPMMISIPPKHSVSSVIGFLKGKSSIWIAQNIANKQKNFVGYKFWSRGYFVSTIGVDEDIIRRYIQDQESADRRLDQLNLFNR